MLILFFKEHTDHAVLVDTLKMNEKDLQLARALVADQQNCPETENLQNGLEKTHLSKAAEKFDKFR